MISSLEALSGFYEENTLKSRRHLRGDVEKRSMSINKQFLEAFEQVDQVRRRLRFFSGILNLLLLLLPWILED